MILVSSFLVKYVLIIIQYKTPHTSKPFTSIKLSFILVEELYEICEV